MARRSAALLLLISLFAASQSASLNSWSQQEDGIPTTELSNENESCARTCNTLNGLVKFQPGQTYSYQVKMATRMLARSPADKNNNQDQSLEKQFEHSLNQGGDDSQSNDLQSHRITAVADITVHSPCELVMKLRDVRIEGIDSAEHAQALQQEPIHFAYEDGRVVSVCTSEHELRWSLNVKKAIISSLQLTTSSLNKEQTVTETDIAGRCETTYIPEEASINTERVVLKKTKSLDKCTQRHQLDTAFFPRSYGLNQVVRSSLPINQKARNVCTQTLNTQTGTLEQSICHELNTMRWPVSVMMHSSVEMKLQDQQPSLMVTRLRPGQWRQHRLLMAPEWTNEGSTFQRSSIGSQHRRYSVNDVQTLLQQINAHVQTSVQLDVPELFVELIQSLHSLTPQQALQVWDQVRNGQLATTQKLVDIFLDASALAGNEGSAQVLIQAYQQQQISVGRANYLFGLFAFSKTPTIEAAQQLVQFVQQQGQQPQQLTQLPRGILFGVTGFVHNLQLVEQQSQQPNPAVQQLVQQFGQFLVQAVQQLVPSVSSSTEQHQVLTIVYAIKNLVLSAGQQDNQSRVQDNNQFAQQLFQVLQQIQPTQHHVQEIRVALVRTLVNAAIDDQIRAYFVTQFIQNPQEGIELQIEAYRAVVLSGATTDQLQQIKQYTDDVSSQPDQFELVNYIRSHQANLRTTSDPHKRSILPPDAPVFQQPSGQFFGVSRNYEFSYVSQALSVGVTAETDVIYDPHQTHQFAPVPQTVAFNLTIPIGGAELQLVEIRLHQHGLEPVIAKYMAQLARFNGQKDPVKVAKKTIEYIWANGAEVLSQNPQVHFLLQILVDGKTVVLFDEHDVISQEFSQSTIIQDLIKKLHGDVNVDRAFAFTPIDSYVQFPSVAGLPIGVHVNSSVVFGFKAAVSFDARDLSNAVVNFAVYPSVASEVQSSVVFAVDQQQKVIEYVQSFYSAPQVNLFAQIQNGRVAKVKFQLPENQYILARWESAVYTRNQHGQRVKLAHPISPKSLQRMPSQLAPEDDPSVHWCTQGTETPLGVQLCFDFTYAVPSAESVDVIAQLSVVKTDPSLRSYELTIESPYTLKQIKNLIRPDGSLSRKDIALNRQNSPFKVIFNTPGSEIDREIVVEIELPSADSRVKEARFRMKSPWKQALAQASIRSEPKEKQVALELTIDEEKFCKLELALETINRGIKVEYATRLVLNMDSVLEAPVNLAGKLAYSQGRKTMWHFQLEDEDQREQYIKGTIIRERGDLKTVPARASVDVTVDLIGLKTKVVSAFELSHRIVKIDLNTDYKLPSWNREESVALGFKLHNMSSGKLIKMASFGMVKVSQYPEYQVQYHQNLLYAAGEQFEHDLKLGWAADDEEQVRLYQTIKKTGQRGKLDLESQSIIVYRPAGVNYEVKAIAALIGFMQPGQKRYTILVNGASRDQPSAATNFKAELAYSQISKSPLNLKLSTSIKSAAIDLVYSDEIEETTPGVYQGHLLVQLSPIRRYPIDYVYTVKADKSKRWQQGNVQGYAQEHTLDFDLKDSRSGKLYKHHGFLRMESPRTFLIQSNLKDQAQGSDVYATELNMKDGETKLKFDHYPRNIKSRLSLDSIERPTNGHFELSTPRLNHESKFELNDWRQPMQGWQINSETKRDQQNWLSIEGKADARQGMHQFALTTEPFEGEYQLNYPEDAEQKLRVRLNAPKRQWSHESTYARNPQRRWISLDSKTQLGQAGKVADVSARYDPSASNYLRLYAPGVKTELSAEMNAKKQWLKKAELNLNAGQYSHQSKLDVDQQTRAIDLQSETKRSGKQLADIEASLSNKGGRIQIQSPDYFDHNSELTYDQTANSWALKSTTERQQRKYQVDAEHRRNKRSALRLSLPVFNFGASYEQNQPKQHQVDVDFTGTPLDTPLKHTSQWLWNNNDQMKPIARFNSQTSRIAPNGQEENLWKIDGAYHHNEPQHKSNLNLKLGDSLKGSMEASLFDPITKQLTMSGEMTDGKRQVYRHQSELKYQPQQGQLNLISTTDRNGEQLAKLDSFFSTNGEKKSYLNLDTAAVRRMAPLKAKLELEPRAKRASIMMVSEPYQHQTEFGAEQHTPGVYMLKTVTTRAQQNLFDLDGKLKPWSEQSHLKVKAGPTGAEQYEGELLVHPEQKFGQIRLRSNALKHDSTFRLDDELDRQQPEQQRRVANFKSNTLYQNQLVADINGQLRGLRGENRLQLESPQYTMMTSVDVPSRQSSFQWRNKHTHRHLLGSVAFNQQQQQPSDKSFHLDFAWDVDNSPASKVQLDVNLKDMDSSLGVSVIAQYAHNKLAFESEFVPGGDILRAPIKISLAYVPQQESQQSSESWKWTLDYQCLPSENRYGCKIDFLVGQQLKYGFVMDGQLVNSKLIFTARTIAPKKPHLQTEISINAGERKPDEQYVEQYYYEVTLVHAESNQYKAILDLTKHRETRLVEGKLEIHLPKMEVHVVSFVHNLSERKFKLDLMNEKTGKQIDLEASYADELVHLAATSNAPFFPTIDVKIRYVPGEELYAKLDLDQERKFELTAKYTGEISKFQFYTLTKVDSVYTPSVEFLAEGRKSSEPGNTERVITLSGKYNMVELVRGQFKGQTPRQWEADAQISSTKGESIIATEVKAIPTPSAQNYQVTVTPKVNKFVSPFVALIQERKPSSDNGHIRSIKVDVTSVDGAQKLVSTELKIKKTGHEFGNSKYQLPESVEFTIEHPPTASHGSFRLASGEVVDKQAENIASLFDTVEPVQGLVDSKQTSTVLRHQALFSWNQKSTGFTLITSAYPTVSTAFEHDLRLYSPVQSGRVIQIRAAHQFSPKVTLIKHQLRTNLATQRDPLYQSTVLITEDETTGKTGRASIESFKFARSPKVVEFTIQPVSAQKPIDLKLRVDVGQSEKQAVTIKAILQHRPLAQQSIFGSVQSQNHTLHFSAKSQDRSVLDFTMDAHVSQSSVGLVWHNLNRRGQQQQGQYLMRFIGENKFEAVLVNPSTRYIVEGSYKRRSGKSESGSLVADFTVAKLISKQQSKWTAGKSEPILVSEHKVHLESVDRCIRAEIEDIKASQSSEQVIRQVNLCVDSSRSSLVNIAIDSIRNGQKVADFSAKVDSRSASKALLLSLQWNPEYSRQLLATLLQLNQQSHQAVVDHLSQHELVQELVHKYNAIGEQVARGVVVEPVQSIIVEEFGAIFAELGLNSQLLEQYVQMITAPAKQVIDQIYRQVTENIFQLEGVYQEWLSAGQEVCRRSETCSKLAQAIYSIQDSEDLVQLLTKPLISLLQKSHRFVVHSQGKLITKLPESVIDWVPAPLETLVKDTIKSVYDIARNWWFNPQNPFTGLWMRFEQIGRELTQSGQWREVRWEQIQSALDESVKLLFSPSVWSSSVRVLAWDPQNGQVMFEVKSPVAQKVSNSLFRQEQQQPQQQQQQKSGFWNFASNQTNNSNKLDSQDNTQQGATGRSLFGINSRYLRY